MKTSSLSIIPALLFSLLLFISANSQTIPHSYLDINNVNARISANANHFWDFQGNPSFEVPKGSGKHTIFAGTFWIGGLDSSGQLYLSAERYIPDGGDFTYGPLSADGHMATDPITIDDHRKTWTIHRSEIQDHIAWTNDPYSVPNYTPSIDILTWPAHGDTTKGQSFYLAPFVDVNNTGVYEPHNGDHPLIRGDQAIYFIFNDAGSPNEESGGTPLGIEVHGMAYAFDCPSCVAFDHTIFMHYRIINRSPRTYHDTYMGLFTDFDIGDPYDDYVGTDVQRGSMYGYNGRPVDGTGAPNHYGANPPAQSITILGGPYMDPDGLDNPAGQCDESINGMNFGNGIVDDERLGLTRAISLHSFAGGHYAVSDPDTDNEHYMYLQGIWRDTTTIQYGGRGHQDLNAYGPECRFMFPGDSDTCNWGTGGIPPNGPQYWTEVTEENIPYDRRGLAITGPITLEAGEEQIMDFAFVYGRDTQAPDSIGHLASVDAMKENIDTVRKAFFNNENPCGGPIITSITERKKTKPQTNHMAFYPNPVNQQLNVRTEKTQTYQYRIYDVYGRLVLHKKTDRTNTFHINTEPLPAGLYILRVSSQNKEMTQKFIKR